MPRFLPLSFMLLASVVMLLVSACVTTAPVQEMSNARQTIQAAVEAGAEIYASEELDKARQLLEQASQELEIENYPLAKDYAVQAKQHALQARQTALLKSHQKE